MEKNEISLKRRQLLAWYLPGLFSARYGIFKKTSAIPVIENNTDFTCTDKFRVFQFFLLVTPPPVKPAQQ